MHSYSKTIFVSGILLLIVGSFLPWQSEGDFIIYWTPGIRIIPRFQDNGGAVILLLAIFILLFMYRLPPELRLLIPSLFLSIILVLLPVYHFIQILLRRGLMEGVVGAPSVEIGLYIVLVGSGLVFLSLLIYLFACKNFTKGS
jgi:hypothetical protein